MYAGVCFKNGCKTTAAVSIHDIAPCVSSDVANNGTVHGSDEFIVYDTIDFHEGDVNSECNNDTSDDDDASVVSKNASKTSGTIAM